MNKIMNVIFAVVMLLTIVFIGDIASRNNPFSVAAQNKVSIKKKKGGGLYGKSKRGTKYVYHKGKGGAIYVYRKGKSGTVYVGKKTWHGGKWTVRKTRKGSKAIYHKTRKVVVGH